MTQDPWHLSIFT